MVAQTQKHRGHHSSQHQYPSAELMPALLHQLLEGNNLQDCQRGKCLNMRVAACTVALKLSCIRHRYKFRENKIRCRRIKRRQIWVVNDCALLSCRLAFENDSTELYSALLRKYLRQTIRNQGATRTRAKIFHRIHVGVQNLALELHL